MREAQAVYILLGWAVEFGENSGMPRVCEEIK